MKRRFVAGNRRGNLQSNKGDTARQIITERTEQRPIKGKAGWWERNYPVIYELVPVSMDELIKAAKGSRP